jgi:hypothetical protein
MRRQIVAVAVYDQLATEDISHPSIAARLRLWPYAGQLMNHCPSLLTYAVVCWPVSVITHTRVNVRGSRC